MIRRAAFFRGLDLGRRRVMMDELRGHLEALGLGDVHTFLASGNAIFEPHVTFLRRQAPAAGLAELEGDDDRFHILDREILWLRRGRLTDAPFSSRDVERAMGGVPSSMRNLNTVHRMLERFG